MESVKSLVSYERKEIPLTVNTCPYHEPALAGSVPDEAAPGHAALARRAKEH